MAQEAKHRGETEVCKAPTPAMAKAMAMACHRVTRQVKTRSLLYQPRSLVDEDWWEEPRRRGFLTGRAGADVDEDDWLAGDGLRTVYVGPSSTSPVSECVEPRTGAGRVP